MTALFCGNRFGRNAVIPGGVCCVGLTDKYKELESWISRVKPELDRALELMFHDHAVCDRFDGTGVVPKEVAESIGLVGMARRASIEFNGDVMARALVRRIEINESHKRIRELIKGGLVERACPVAAADGRISVVVSTVGAWRGPLVHAALFGLDGKMARYKIVDPSSHNWSGLAWALRGEQISNFPICNKSFNLSYCGTDR
jgi:Ni,Fe-hydrogenase III large subunit